MAPTAVLGYLPSQRQNTNVKKLTIKKLSESGLRRRTKVAQAHSSDERKKDSLILHVNGIFGI